MTLIAGIDYSTYVIDVVLLDEDSREAVWRRYELEGADAFERTRNVWVRLMLNEAEELWWLDDCIAIGIEEPQGAQRATVAKLKAIQGAILATLPSELLVYPWVPNAWRKAAGLSGNASKEQVADFAKHHSAWTARETVDWPQDACDAYCIALATEAVLQRTEEQWKEEI